MRNLLCILCIAAISVAIFYGLHHYYTSSYIHTFLQERGFLNSAYAEKTYENNKLIYKNISLDDEGFSIIESISIPMEWNNIFLVKPTQNTAINGVEINALWDESKNVVDVLDFDFQKFISPLHQSQFISFTNTIFDLHTLIGALRFTGDFKMQSDPNQKLTLQGAFDANQYQLKTKGKLDALFPSNDMGIYNISFEETAIKTETLKLGRMTGAVSAIFDQKTLSSLNGNIAIGNLNYSEISLSGLTFKIKTVDNRIVTDFVGLVPNTSPVTISGTFTYAAKSITSKNIILKAYSRQSFLDALQSVGPTLLEQEYTYQKLKNIENVLREYDPQEIILSMNESANDIDLRLTLLYVENDKEQKHAISLNEQ